MRIIANERDYYDGYMNHDKKDRFNKVWVRKETELLINKKHLVNLEKRSLKIARDGWDTGYLILAGVVTPYVSFSPRSYRDDHVYFYTAKDANNFYEKQKKPKVSYHWDHFYQGWGKKSLKKYFVAFFAPYPDMTNLCVLNETPVILIQPTARWYTKPHVADRVCYSNVNLKDMGLSKYIDAPTLYQNLDVFVSNVLVNDDMVMKPISDNVKVKIHGFDPKYGFRTRKKDRE